MTTASDEKAKAAIRAQKSEALLAGVRNDLDTGGVCARRYLAFATEQGIVEAAVLAAARRMIAEHAELEEAPR